MSPLPPAVPWDPGKPLSPFSPGSPGGPIRPIRPGWPWSRHRKKKQSDETFGIQSGRQNICTLRQMRNRIDHSFISPSFLTGRRRKQLINVKQTKNTKSGRQSLNPDNKEFWCLLWLSYLTIVGLSTCGLAELWPSASGFTLALNQWPLGGWHDRSYTYSFSALNQSKSSSQSLFFLSLRGNRANDRSCLLKAPDKAQLQIREIPNKTVWKQHGDNALPSLPWIQSHLSYREDREVPMEETNQIVMDMKWIHIILWWQPP